MGYSKTTVIANIFIYVVTMLIIGMWMYYAGYNANRSPPPKIDISQILQNEISAANIDLFLRKLSSVPHLAGTPQDLEQAVWLRDKFLEYGLDRATVVPYHVLLSYPNMTHPNLVYLMNSNGQPNFTTSGKQTPLYAEEENSNLVAPNFNAYSGTGIIETDGLVYVYYGQEAHYDYLAKLGIDVTNKTVLARYGGTFRGNIVDVAQKRGAKGVLLYSDPKDYAKKGRNQIYPESWWMPGTAVQLGSVYMSHGDPLTPFYPSIDGAYQIPMSKALLPDIPVQPIGYDEAEIFLRAIKEGQHRAPTEWRGDLEVDYFLGPELKDGWKIKMEIHTANKVATIHNTIGILNGEEEPDRYVLAGNHRDAWILGSLDPSGGTACMLEMARAFGKIKKENGWRPRRSLLFCSWGAEEYGLIGSSEWVEQNAKVLSQRAVAYLNIDVAVSGNYSLRAMAAPLIRDVLVHSSKKIPNPNPDEIAAGRPTVYDTWFQRFPDPNHQEQPRVAILGSGSDFTPFMHNLGVPSMHFLYMYEEDVANYPLYHTLHETHYLLAEVLDKNFVHHRAITQLWAEIARNLTESVVLPMNVTWYATYLTENVAIIKSRYESQLLANNATLGYVESAVTKFTAVAWNYQEKILNRIDSNNILAVRRNNDKLMQLERHFVDPHGLPNRNDYNHIVFAPSSSDSYAGSSFCGLTDLLESVGNKTEAERPTEWVEIKQHLAVIAFYIEAAGRSLTNSICTDQLEQTLY